MRRHVKASDLAREFFSSLLDTPGNTIVPILLTGQLNDGTDFVGSDVVRITPNNIEKSRGKGGKGPK